MSQFTEFSKGLFKENPALVLMLGLCPSLAVTTSVDKALGMGLAASFVLVASNVMVSLVRNVIPADIRIPSYIVIIAAFVTVVKLVMAAYFPALKESLGIFLALIVVNCIILGRAEAFASKNGPWLSALDGLGMGLGFTGALCLIGAIREVFGNGSFYGIPLADGLKAYTQSVLILPAGGFLVMSGLLALLQWRRNRITRGA